MTERDDPLVDRDALAHGLGELRPGLPDPGDVFATLQRVIDATRTVFQVDGASLALAHEDGSLRWVVVTAMAHAGGCGRWPNSFPSGLEMASGCRPWRWPPCCPRT